MRTRILVAVLALTASAAIAACGGSPIPSVTDGGDVAPPVTFTQTVAVPTTTVPAPTNASYIGPEGVPIETGPFLAAATTTALGRTINGIQCEGVQQLAYRTYAHLQVYVHGQARALPGGIGLVDPAAAITSNGLLFSAGTCYYWLHTLAADGVVQAESPTPRRFTLGDFFAVWQQQLTRSRVSGATGAVTAIVNGKRWRGNPRAIPLTERASIELAVGTPVPKFGAIDWTGSGF